MSHSAQLDFVTAVRDLLISNLPEIRVLEVGSYDVNGSVRALFNGCRSYVGSDLTPGPGVDVVRAGQDLDFQDGYFDVSLSCECFEHNPEWIKTFANMIRMTREGGIIIISCASRGRLEHGTSRTNPLVSPGTQAIGLDYYQNLTKDDFVRNFNLVSHFDSHEFFYLPQICDLYFVGIRKRHVRIPENLDALKSAVEAISKRISIPLSLRHLMFLLHTHYPLRILAYILPDSTYRDIAFHYMGFKSRIKNLFSGKVHAE